LIPVIQGIGVLDYVNIKMLDLRFGLLANKIKKIFAIKKKFIINLLFSQRNLGQNNRKELLS
jgi:hypothetical protein